jgi:Uma2 family endonuclease
MSSPAASAPYTWDDFVALEEDDLRELIDGELVEVEVPTLLHEYIVSRLCGLLNDWTLPRKAGFAVASGYKVRITNRRGVMPDVQFFRVVEVLGDDAVFRPGSFEGLEIPLAELWTMPLA